MAAIESFDDTIALPRAVRFPVELVPPPGFDPGRLETWPRVSGRLEWVDERLLFMPPCGDLQQDTVADLVTCLGPWVREHPAFVLGANEAGMRLGNATRAADAAVWRRSDVGEYRGGLRRVPPILAVEVGGADEQEPALRVKAGWYRERGVTLVWLLLPERREVVTICEAAEGRHVMGERLPAHAALPGLAPRVDDLFRQVSAKSPS